MNIDQVNPNIEQAKIEFQNYNFPQEDQLTLRIQENLQKYGSTYAKLFFIIIVIASIFHIWFFSLMILTCGVWYILLKRPDLLEGVPVFGLHANQKLMIIAFINLLIISILFKGIFFSACGISSLIVLLHATFRKIDKQSEESVLVEDSNMLKKHLFDDIENQQQQYGY